MVNLYYHAFYMREGNDYKKLYKLISFCTELRKYFYKWTEWKSIVGVFKVHYRKQTFKFQSTILDDLRPRHDREVGVSKAVGKCCLRLVESHLLDNGPCVICVILHTLRVEYIPGCMVEQMGTHVGLERVDKHILFLHDDHLGWAQSYLNKKYRAPYIFLQYLNGHHYPKIHLNFYLPFFCVVHSQSDKCFCHHRSEFVPLLSIPWVTEQGIQTLYWVLTKRQF